MCGIAGYSLVHARRAGTEVALGAACDFLAHRGPDDAGLFEDRAAGVGLAHRRLSILDLSVLGHQPMAGDGGIALSYNGEIYNFRELRDELETAGVPFRGTSDTEVLLQMYVASRTDPAAMLRRLNGIFALAIWDPGLGCTLVARDALGVKPLYVAERPDRVVFASEIKALLPLVGESIERDDLDFASLYRYGTYLWCPGDGTPVRWIRKVAPGEMLTLRDGRIETRRTWYVLPAQGDRSLPKQRDTADLVAETRSRLRTAVHRQMVADVPVGAFLSGGLDSSAVVAFAREVNQQIACFTIDTGGGVDESTPDDLPYARKVAAHLSVPLHVIRVDSAGMADGLSDMIAQLDEPLADPAPLNVLFISRLAREHGIKVLLSGAGGDDLFTGYRRHTALWSARYWQWLPASVRSALARTATALDQRRGVFRRAAKGLAGAALEGDARLVDYLRWTAPADLLPLYTADVRAAVAGVRVDEPLLGFLEALPASTTPLARMLALEQRFFLADHNLIYTDKMSMAEGIEARVPFLDLDLVDFAATLPDNVKQRGPVGKWILKEAMTPFLPSDVIHRRKTGFGAPVRRWMRVELHELLTDVFSEASLRRHGLFDPLALQRLVRANDEGRVDAGYTLLSVLCIELWCRRFLDGGSVASHRPSEAQS